ncbi:DUF1684 domain-containing protein [Polaribacter sp. 11A2H]|uniref:DUF1684 domain-containing protein n=1 Tax=Polaribacter sp. 11A2H TaxID=2687290 RepID=UPI00140ADBA0|nr:DUF1684 domain-containing protein [Polaribacter sp. 11A2H]
MKKIVILLSVTFLLMSCNSQGKRPLIGKTIYQQELNASYKDASKSPLKKKDLKKFKGLDFFDIDSTFIVTSKLVRIENAPTFEMATTTDRKPLYKEYGKLHFTLQGKKCELTIYQSQDDLTDEKYKDYLFLPFTDDTSGEESYGGGRYMDVMLTDITAESTISLNFNNTYNPYCAYNEKYSCPITPRKNHLDVEIKAGIKSFKKILRK